MTNRRGWWWAALAFAVGYGGLRLFRAAGGRWGHTACDRAAGAAELASGCAAAGAPLPFWAGWGAVGLCGLLAGVAALGIRGSRTAAAPAWAACAALVVLAFPMHLLFEVPAGLAGRPTDWPDVADRLLLLGGGLVSGAAAATLRPPGCGHPRVPAGRPVPGWLRRWAYAAVAVPVVGWAVPHGLWLFGVPVGIPAAQLREIRTELVDTSPVVGAAIVGAPVLGALLTVGLIRPWGRIFPSWLPWLAGRRVPRPLALAPASAVALCLTFYGVLSSWIVVDGLRTGETTWSDVRTGWAVTATVVVFVAWGVALGVTTWGYHLLTRTWCPTCAAAGTQPSSTAGHPAPAR